MWSFISETAAALSSSLLSGVFLRFPAHHCLRLYESVRPSGELPLMQHCLSAFDCVCICACHLPPSSPPRLSLSSVTAHSQSFCVIPRILLSKPSAEWQSCNFSMSADGRLDVLRSSASDLCIFSPLVRLFWPHPCVCLGWKSACGTHSVWAARDGHTTAAANWGSTADACCKGNLVCYLTSSSYQNGPKETSIVW